MMGAAEEILRQATEAQRRAADADASVWVAASAGSGKTKVLTDRVLTLLLHGTAPDKVLCLTFTKAAAAEMSNRLAERLSHWAVIEDAKLTKELSALLGRVPPEEMLLRARRLFALVLDAPGGIKIQTLHGFCQSLLGRFPLEAGIAPRLRVLDEREAAALLETARVEVLAGGADSRQDGTLATDIAEVVAQAHEVTFTDLLSELIRERARLNRLMAAPGGLAAASAGIFDLLGADPAQEPAALERAACDETALDRPGLEAVLAAYKKGTATEQKNALRLQAWLAGGAAERQGLLEDYMALFLTTTDGVPRKRLLTKAAMAAVPAAEAPAAAEADRLKLFRDRRKALIVARANGALLRIASAILARYDARKRAACLLDYDDLILTASDLLRRDGAAAWVLYKLDRGIDHILIDEGQDTNPEQWQVVKALADEFFAGEGVAETTRTLFVVGDAKQSIFSFQRADPQAFEGMRQYFAGRVLDAEMTWREVPLDVSFRSTAAVLSAVDRVFADAAVRKGVVFGEAEVSHRAVRAAQPGLVELWPPMPAAVRDEDEPWSLPLSHRTDAPAIVRLARALARKIHHWTLDPAGAADPESFLIMKSRRIRPGDVMILVRRRNEFVEELVRALKGLDVPVVGVDRMVLTDQLAVQDLVALGRVALLPEDDLTLAAVLKGPLIALSEERLFDLAYGRPGSLWDALSRAARQAGPEAEPFRAARDLLVGLLRRADFVPPYEFYAAILGPAGGRRRILARLGPEAGDAIDEFLSLALAYGRDQAASLEGFLHWLEGGQQEVKRDMETGGDAVRIMTVHGAKGLQAPLVILPDTLQTPQSPRGLFWLTGEIEGAPFWAVRSELDGPLAAGLRDRARQLQSEEYRRLLYVAMTRAEDRLYIAGWESHRDPPADCWFALIQEALTGASDKPAQSVNFDFSHLGAGDWAGPGLRLVTAPSTASEIEELPHVAAGAPSPRPPLPAWLHEPAPGEPDPPRPLAPSRPAETAPAVRSPLAEAEEAAYRRGRMVHRLLEVLPELPADQRPAAGERLIADSDLPGGAAARGAVLAEVLAIIEDPAFATLFGPDSRAEVPLVGLVEGRGGTQVVSGQVDRLAIGAGQVLVVDYKSNRPPPSRIEDVPVAYLRQLAAYRAVLARIYPEKTISCALLWTAVPSLMQISDALLAAHAP